MKIALVTGASSGLGQAFVQRLERDPEVEGYWLVARRRERMEQLAASLSKPAEIFSLDLLRRDVPFFSLKLRYQGETLVYACLNGRELVL